MPTKPFSDRRSKKIVFAVHCIFNQNARIDGCGYFPGVIAPPARALVESGAGIIQMPCPELLYAGLDRGGRRCMKIGIRESMPREAGQKACRAMAKDIIYQIKEYRKHGFSVLGVIGNNGSPSCGVTLTWSFKKDKNIKGTGAFIKVLRDALKKNRLAVPFIAIQDHEWGRDAVRIKEFIKNR
jgi:predicted secreted protein